MELIAINRVGGLKSPFSQIFQVPDYPGVIDFSDIFDFSPIIELLLTLGGLVFLLVIMAYFFKNLRVFPVILVIFIISLVVGFNALEVDIPFSPIIQLVFILVQSCFFLITCLDVFRGVKSTLKLKN